ncbi:transmembrane protein 63A [Cichlidogyrus casuarinus]|uniref:Transmembrane protein 63A n=1 Tax=Cichlidogyrus casuarinus TaxID=1844966 RepID=A0ABD2Q9F7_9PLAT
MILEPVPPTRLECLFLPDGGGLFVCLVCTAALAGNGLNLVRIGSLIYAMFMRIFKVHSEPEILRANQKAFGQFAYGESFAFILCMNTIIIMYAPICPLIVPFGALFFLLRYLTDKQNFLNAYTTVPHEFTIVAPMEEEQFKDKLDPLPTKSAEGHCHLDWHITCARYSLVGLIGSHLNVIAFLWLRQAKQDADTRLASLCLIGMDLVFIILSVLLLLVTWKFPWPNFLWFSSCELYTRQQQEEFQTRLDYSAMEQEVDITLPGVEKNHYSLNSVNSAHYCHT